MQIRHSTAQPLAHYTHSLSHQLDTTTDLDPGEEDHDGQRRVEHHFPVAENLEVAVLVGVGKQLLQDSVDLDGAVDVEADAADGHDDHDDVQDVPERLEIRQLQLPDLSSHDDKSQMRAFRRLVIDPARSFTKIFYPPFPISEAKVAISEETDTQKMHLLATLYLAVHRMGDFIGLYRTLFGLDPELS